MKKNLIKLIRKNLTDDLLKPAYRGRPEKYAGHCYVATECFYYIYGRYNGWKPKCYKYENGETHWWLEKDGEVLDITAQQLTQGFDYSKGRSQFFVNYPSKRCLMLSGRVEKAIWDKTFAGQAEIVRKELATLKKVIFEEAKKDIKRVTPDWVRAASAMTRKKLEPMKKVFIEIANEKRRK